MKVRLSASTNLDFEKVARHYKSHAPAQALRLAKEMRSVLKRLGEYPESSQATDLPKIRRAVLRHFPFVVFYTVRPNEISVVHIRHTSRAPWDEGEN